MRALPRKPKAPNNRSEAVGMSLLQPDEYFARVSSISVRFDLLARGLTTVLIDIDNTVRSREDGRVPADIEAWLSECEQAGVSVCLLSNNWHENVFDLAERLDLPIVAKAMKPLPGGYLVALRTMHAKARETVVVGDQVFTDIIGAKALGIRTYLVAPLAEVDLPHMALLRNVERAIVGEAPTA